MFTFTCPFCRQEIEAEEAWVGQVADCPNCGQSIEIKRTASPKDQQPHIADAAYISTNPETDSEPSNSHFSHVLQMGKSFLGTCFDRLSPLRKRPLDNQPRGMNAANGISNTFSGFLNPVTDYERNAAYFHRLYQPFKRHRLMGLCIGILGIIPVGWIILILLFLTRKSRMPTDEEIDAQVIGMSSNMLRARAFEKLGLDGDEVMLAEPIELWGYSLGERKLFNGYFGLGDAKGLDNVWRSPEVVFNAFYFTEKTVIVYHWVKSLTADSFAEASYELFYDDIVGIKIESSDSPILKWHWKTGLGTIRGKVAHVNSASILNSAGDSFDFEFRDSDAASIVGFRNLLRERKGRA